MRTYVDRTGVLVEQIHSAPVTKLNGRQRAVRVRARLGYVVSAEANRSARGVARVASAREWHREETDCGSAESGLIPSRGFPAPSEGALKAKTKETRFVLKFSVTAILSTTVAVFFTTFL